MWFFASLFWRNKNNEKKTDIEMNINIPTPKPEIKRIDFPKSIRLDRYDIKIWVKWEIIDWKRTEKWLVYKDSWSLFINYDDWIFNETQRIY